MLSNSCASPLSDNIRSSFDDGAPPYVHHHSSYVSSDVPYSVTSNSSQLIPITSVSSSVRILSQPVHLNLCLSTFLLVSMYIVQQVHL